MRIELHCVPVRAQIQHVILLIQVVILLIQNRFEVVCFAFQCDLNGVLVTCNRKYQHDNLINPSGGCENFIETGEEWALGGGGG